MLLCCLLRNVDASCHTFRRPLPPSTNSAPYQRLLSVINSPWSVAAKCIALAAFTVHSTRWSQILAQNRDLPTPIAFYAPVSGASPSAYRHDVWCGKTRLVWRAVWLYPMVKIFWSILKICLFVLTEFTNVTDRQTDRNIDTTWRHKPCLHSIARQKVRKHVTSIFLKVKPLGVYCSFLHVTFSVRSLSCRSLV